MNKAKGQRLLKYIYFLSSALFLWSCASSFPKQEPPEIRELKEIVAAGEILAQSDLSNYSQDVQEILSPLAGNETKSLGAIYVSVRGGSTTQDGSSWENAYNAASLKIAIDIAGIAASASKPYLVLIASGTYIINTSLNMQDNVAIIGGIDSDWNPAESILDGAGSIRVFYNSGVNSTAVLYGVTVTNGNTKNDGGGGMYNNNSSPMLSQVTFSNNKANFGKGGGMYNIKSSPTLKQVIFSGNETDNRNYGGDGAGGMYNIESSPTLKQVVFLGNKAIGSGTNGGGMYNKDSSPTLNQVVFSNNTATKHGGGMYNEDSSPTLEQVTFSNNNVSNKEDYAEGGGMYNYSSSPTLVQVTFSNNKTNSKEGYSKGGGMYNYDSSPTLNWVTFSNNTVSNKEGYSRGGGMYNADSSLTLKQVTFSNNKVSSKKHYGEGGGMYNDDSSLTLNRITFSNNTASSSGGGVYNEDSLLTLNRVTFLHNKANWGGGLNNNTSSLTLKQVTFSENKAAEDGGGMYNQDSSPTLVQVTFSNNKAKRGGGMINDSDVKIGSTITNSIFWGNTPNQIYMINDRDGSDENLQIYYSILEGGTAGILESESTQGAAVNITSYGIVETTDAKLASHLADNGGFVRTLALQPESPAINAGIYLQQDDSDYYYSEDASTWYRTLDANGLSAVGIPPDTAIDLTTRDARGYAIVDRPDLGAYEFEAKAP